VARRLRVALTYADHTAATRAVTLRGAALDAELWDAARRAFTQANARRLAVRGVALTLDRLEEAEGQLELWGMGVVEVVARGKEDDGRIPSPSHPALQHAIDRIRTRYGVRAIGRSSVVGRESVRGS
jgi:hypothetical protein